MQSVAFRVDASIRIGTGHIMRCLTLADTLCHKGLKSTFICREHPGHLADVIRGQGHTMHLLPFDDRGGPPQSEQLTHASWLGTTQERDAAECRPILEYLRPQWLVVDHYALNEQWEKSLQDCCDHLLVIDDLADRHHECEILLDQNLGRVDADYLALTPKGCRRLIGPRYALLRQEFSVLRNYSISRRREASLGSLLVTMGGVDAANATGRVLQALDNAGLPEETRITVIMGMTAPHLAAVRELAEEMSVATQVLVGVRDMARHMAESDLCIGAAGGTAWERCCLGVPTLLVVLAENQAAGAAALAKVGAAEILDTRRIDMDLPRRIYEMRSKAGHLARMSLAALGVTAGTGAQDVADIMMSRERANYG